MKAVSDFRAELLKHMPGYGWTVHRTKDPAHITATGTQVSGFNRLSTLQVIRKTDAAGLVSYEAKSAGHGTKSAWAHANADRTLARALRGLQDHYERKANTYRQLAQRLQGGRSGFQSD